MKKTCYIIVTVLSMLIISRFLIRIFDATKQIDDYWWFMWLVLILTNAAIGYCSYRLYRAKKGKDSR